MFLFVFRLFFGCSFFFLIKCQLCVYGPPMQWLGMVGRAPPFLSLTLWLFMLSVWVFVGPHINLGYMLGSMTVVSLF